jgi:hypothetical protein
MSKFVDLVKIKNTANDPLIIKNSAFLRCQIILPFLIQ